MEILKMKTITLLMLLITVLTANSQTQEQLKTAFAKSYSLESEYKYSEAIEILSQIYSEKKYEINFRLGWLQYLAGNNNQSIIYYQIAIKLMPAATEPHWGIINPYAAKEDWVNVEKTYLEILKLDSKNYLANYRLGLIYYYRKNYSKAQPYFNTVLNLNPFDYDILLITAWTNFFLGKNNDAKVLFNKALLNRPNDVSALEGLSLIK